MIIKPGASHCGNDRQDVTFDDHVSCYYHLSQCSMEKTFAIEKDSARIESSSGPLTNLEFEYTEMCNFVDTVSVTQSVYRRADEHGSADKLHKFSRQIIQQNYYLSYPHRILAL